MIIMSHEVLDEIHTVWEVLMDGYVFHANLHNDLDARAVAADFARSNPDANVEYRCITRTVHTVHVYDGEMPRSLRLPTKTVGPRE